jgi:plastocyanin
MTWTAGVAAASLALLALSGCGDRLAEVAVDLRAGHQVDPPLRTIGQGDAVRWHNRDTVAHTVTSDEPGGPLNSGPIPPGAEYSYTFNALGTYRYHSDSPGDAAKGADGTFTGMVGTVAVEA